DLIAISIALLATLASPRPAAAVSRWEPYAGVFAGAQFVVPFDIDEVDPTLPSQVVYHDIDSKTAFEGGGMFGVWRRGAHNPDLGVRFNFSYAEPDTKAQPVPVTGTSAGEVVNEVQDFD